MQPILSIIIPVYNVEQYLSECLASLQLQSFNNEVEIIFIDDGSTDSSGSMLDIAAKENPQYRVIHQENCGVARARNRGLDEARGEYIAWIDPDDYVLPDWYDSIRPSLLQCEDMVLFDWFVLQDACLSSRYYDKVSHKISTAELAEKLSYGIRIPSYLWSMIFRRDFYDGKRFDETLSFQEDYALLHEVAVSVKSCAYIRKAIYVYRQREGSLVHRMNGSLETVQSSIHRAEQRRSFFALHGYEFPPVGRLYIEQAACYAYWGEKQYRDNPSSEAICREFLHDLRKHRMLLLRIDYGVRNKIKLFLLLCHLTWIFLFYRWLRNFIRTNNFSV